MQRKARKFHGVAVDAGSGLEETLRQVRGVNARADDLSTFKRCVLEELGIGASTALVDAQLGIDLLQYYPKGCEPTRDIVSCDGTASKGR